MPIFCRLFLLAFVLFHPWAQEAPAQRPADETQLRLDLPEESSPPIQGDIGVWDFIRMLLVLALMVALIWGFVRLLRRFSQRPTEEVEGVRLLATFTLSGTRVIYFLEVGSRVFALGGSEGGLSFLFELEDQALIDALRLAASHRQKPTTTFLEMVQKWLRRPAEASGAGDRPVDRPLDFLQKQRRRLENLEIKGPEEG